MDGAADGIAEGALDGIAIGAPDGEVDGTVVVTALGYTDGAAD